jgi:TatD DNase family protein
MRFADAHVHLSDPEYDGKIGEIVEGAKQARIVAMISNSMDLQTSKKNLRLADDYKDLIYAALGIHPWNANKLAPNELQATRDLVLQNRTANGKLVAIGEVGLDPQYAKRKKEKESQAKVFHEMLSLAEKVALPVIVHSRWSASRIIEILSSYRVRGVLWHWFSGPVELLPKIVERADYISEGPPTVFSPQIQEIVRLVTLENLLTETDGPVPYSGPFKGRVITPAFIPDVVKAIAKIKGVKGIDAAEQIFSNFTKLFKITMRA